MTYYLLTSLKVRLPKSTPGKAVPINPSPFTPFADPFLFVTAGEESVTGIEWVESRKATEYPTVYRTPPPSKRLSGPKVNKAEVETGKEGVSKTGIMYKNT